MKQILVNYGFNQGTLTLFCDNISAINISKNPVQHFRTKHIKELVENKCIVLEHVGTNDQLADLFTKPSDATRFHTLCRSIGICLVDWYGLEFDPIRGTQAKRANLHTCHMQKFEKSYASLLTAWVS